MNRRLAVLLFALLFAVAASLDGNPGLPTVTWASDPVGPDETVLLLGGGFGREAVIEAGRAEDQPAKRPGEGLVPVVKRWETIGPLQTSDHSIKLVVPATWKQGVFACRVRMGNQVSNVAVMNPPDPWWLQADEGAAGTPGGWLRVFGKCLSLKGTAQILLLDKQGVVIPLKPKQASCWSLSADLSKDLRVGEYSVFVHNSFGGDATWRKAGTLAVIPPVQWKSDVFNVRDFGSDSDKAIRAALEKAKENGGGVVYLPRGTYDVKGQLVIPPNTVLKGESRELVSLHWPNVASPPDSLITGARFGLEDLSLYCFNYVDVIADNAESDRLRLRRVLIRAVPDAVRVYVVKAEREPFAALHLLGRNFQITDCDLYAGVPGLAPGRAVVTGPYGFTGTRGPWYGVMANNRIFGHLFGCENLKGLIFENNNVQGVAVGASTYWNNFSQNLYFAKNQVQHVYGGDREIMTFDGAGGAYFGKVAEVRGTLLTLAADPRFHDYAPKPHTDYAGGVVMILDGTGAGQYRYVAKNEGRSFEVDRPWDLAPDDTSLISIAPFRGRNLFIGNTFTDGGAVQLYGAALDVIVAENRGARIDGFYTWGLNGYNWGWQPTWRCQFLDNELAEGTGYGARVWGPAFFGVITGDSNQEYSGPLARATLFRRNVLQSNAFLRVEGVTEDTLVEHCAIRRSETGIRVGKTAKNTLLRNNTFEDVAKPLDGDGLPESCIVPAVKP